MQGIEIVATDTTPAAWSWVSRILSSYNQCFGF